MLKIERTKKRTIEEWIEVFSHAKHGHILWDGWAENPYDPIHAYNGAHQFVNQASYHGFFGSGGNVLDLGCGNGRLGIALSEKDVNYVGIDPMKECIDFSQWAFREYPRFQFHFADVYNEVFNKNGATKPQEYVIPYEDEYFSDVIAYSVFTHLQTLEAAINYMNEVWRVTKPGGRLFVSWYRSPPNAVTNFVGRTVYLEADIMNMMAGFSMIETYGGHTDAYYDQWGLFAIKI
jgi:SAM-dependent methyltransferase